MQQKVNEPEHSRKEKRGITLKKCKVNVVQTQQKVKEE